MSLLRSDTWPPSPAMADRASAATEYVLGIDLGTTYSAAAIVRGSTVEPFVLGTIAAQIPSVVVHREDGHVLIGEAAERRAGAEPTRAAREFKRRLGDPVPIIVGGTPYGAESLMSEMLQAIVGQVTEREGRAPSTIVLTHPANYSDYKLGLLHEAARLAGLDLTRVRLITEPEAAAIAYAHHERVDDGEIIAVYDFGGGTFDAAVVRGAGDEFELIGTPEGMERLGGIDVDQAVLAHVDRVLDGLVSGADASDPNVLAGQARLRDECRRAKEALSSDTDATIPVSIPGVQTEVRLTRDELEHMVHPRIVETVDALQRTIASAGIATVDVDRVLLVGGTSRMPIVAQTVRDLIGRPISVDADPKLSIATGAALSAGPAAMARRTQSQAATVERDAPTVSPAPAARPAVPAVPQNGRRRPMGVIVGAAIAAAVVAVALVVVLSGGDDSNDQVTEPVATAGVQTETNPENPASSASTASAVSSPVPTDVATEPTAVQLLAFDGQADGSGIPGPALAASVPVVLTAIVVVDDGDVYAATQEGAVVHVIDGQVDFVPGLAAADQPIGGLAVGSAGEVFVSVAVGIVRVVDGVAELVLDAAAAGLGDQPGPLVLDGGGNLYIADNGTFRVVRLAPDGGLTLVAGTGAVAPDGSIPVEGAVAATSDIGRVAGLAIDAGGRLLIADAGLRRIRAVAADGTIATVAGGGSIAVGSVEDVPDGTAATDLAFEAVLGVAVDRDRRVHVPVGAAVIGIDADGSAIADLSIDDLAVSVTALATSPSGTLIVTDGLVLWGVAGDGT